MRWGMAWDPLSQGWRSRPPGASWPRNGALFACGAGRPPLAERERKRGTVRQAPGAWAAFSPPPPNLGDEGGFGPPATGVGSRIRTLT